MSERNVLMTPVGSETVESWRLTRREWLPSPSPAQLIPVRVCCRADSVYVRVQPNDAMAILVPTCRVCPDYWVTSLRLKPGNYLVRFYVEQGGVTTYVPADELGWPYGGERKGLDCELRVMGRIGEELTPISFDPRGTPRRAIERQCREFRPT